MTLPTMSVIVPVYNVERYLAQCLDSLVAQTHRDLELIVVNDGSTDSSAAIIEEYRRRDSRITFVDQSNQGLSAARNAGLERASGTFTAFVDADDWVSVDMFATLLGEAVETNADIVICTYMREYDNRSVEKHFDMPERVQFSRAQTREVLLRQLVGPVGKELARLENMSAFTTAWGKVYRTSLLKEHALRFVDTAEIGNEDGLFNIQAFAVARQTVFIKKALYHYRRDNPGSLTSVYRPRLQEQWERLFDRIESIIRENTFPGEFWEALSNRRAIGLFALSRNVLHSRNDKSFFGRYKKVKSLLQDKALSGAVQNLPLSFFPLHWKMFFLLAKQQLTLPFYLMVKAADAMI
jgi:glycosyltransferase involved in cell wall biosynthesis